MAQTTDIELPRHRPVSPKRTRGSLPVHVAGRIIGVVIALCGLAILVMLVIADASSWTTRARMLLPMYAVSLILAGIAFLTLDYPQRPGRRLAGLLLLPIGLTLLSVGILSIWDGISQLRDAGGPARMSSTEGGMTAGIGIYRPSTDGIRKYIIEMGLLAAAGIVAVAAGVRHLLPSRP